MSCSRTAVLGVLVALGAVALGACSGASSPQVASVGTTTAPAPSTTVATSTNVGRGNGNSRATTTSPAARSASGNSTGSTAATVPKNDAARSLVEWANCMRSHGDPEQPDPTIDAQGGINIFIPGGDDGAASLSNAVHNGTAPCNQYLAAASAALRAGATDLTPPDQTALLEFSQCMRANGVPGYPDPGAGGTTNFNGTGIDPNSPAFLNGNANQTCGKQVGAPAWWINNWGPPGSVDAYPAGTNPNDPLPPGPPMPGGLKPAPMPGIAGIPPGNAHLPLVRALSTRPVHPSPRLDAT
jgi:hypothetical protein